MSDSAQRETPILKDGAEWVDHEDCIIGNAAGLESLRRACDAALSEGEYFGSDLGDWVGLKRLDSAWFATPEDSKSTRFANALLALSLALVLVLAAVGAYTAGAWLRHAISAAA